MVTSKITYYDVLKQLTPIKWGTIVLPVISISNRFNPRLESNSFMNSDSDYIRDMGQGSREFDVELAFDVSLGTYPNTYRSFLLAVKNRKPLQLNHPILGLILCYVSAYSDSIVPTNRSGVRANVTFKETLSPMSSAEVELKVYASVPFGDFEIKAASELPENKNKPTLFDTLNQINNLENQLKGTVLRGTMKINSTVNKMKNAVNSATNTLKLAENTSNMLAVAALRGKLEMAKEKETKPNLKMHIVEKDMSIFELVSKLETTIDILHKINSSILGKAIIPKNTIVFY